MAGRKSGDRVLGIGVNIGEPPAPVADPPLRAADRLLGLCRGPTATAAMAWLVTAPVAALLPSRLHLNPFRESDAVVPLVFGGLLLAGLGCLARWRRSPALAGAAAGLLASWTVLLLRTSWDGTPFGAGGLFGDAGRLTAMATRYTVAWHSSDGIVAAVPSEYPPLFPWLIGRAAVLLDVPAWRLVAPALILALSGSIVASFALWRRLTSPAAALVISALGLLALGKPDKAYEVLALAFFVPLMLGTVAAPPGRRLHWLPAGLAAGLLVLLYQGYLLYGAIGLAALLWQAWRAETDRRAYLWYVARVAAVMLLASSWYVLPYAWAMLHGGQQVSDLYESSSITGSPLPFLAMTPLGVLQAIGLAGLLWLYRSVWWAAPLLTVVLGVYAYYLVALAKYVTTGHTSFLHYVFPLISTCLLAAGVLTCAHLAPEIQRRVGASAGAAAVAVVLAFTGYSYWQFAMPVTHWIPGRTGVGAPDLAGAPAGNLQAARAHLQPLPDGRRPRYSAPAAPAGTLPWFPADQTRRTVEGVLGKGTRPYTLAYDQQLFAFLPWKGYIAVDRGSASTLSRWDDRYAELRRLSAISEPLAFAAASAHTRFGPIDVFVLHREAAGLVWRPSGGPGPVVFQQAQLASFVVVPDLPEKTVVAIRR